MPYLAAGKLFFPKGAFRDNINQKHRIMPNRKTCFMADEDFMKIRSVYARFNEPWTEDEVDELKTMFADGVPMEDLASHLQRTPNSLKIKLQSLGLLEKKPAAKPWRPEDDDALVRLYNDGVGFDDMAGRFGRFILFIRIIITPIHI